MSVQSAETLVKTTATGHCRPVFHLDNLLPKNESHNITVYYGDGQNDVGYIAKRYLEL